MLNTLVIAVLLVGGVVLFFLQDWKAMILPMIDVPVSLVGTFAVMAALGFSLNNLTLFGLVLAIGIVVDDAIMVLENIERLMATGLDARTATIKAMDELTGPIVAITLVLSSVFLPSCFIPGLTGQFYRQFALTIAASVIISAINAMTLTPSRAVSIFRTEEAGAEPGGKRGRRHPKKEALPWWIFGIVGGLLTAWLAPRFLAGHLGLPAAPAEEASSLQKWLYWGATFSPGLLVGLVAGWFLIGPVNAVLGWFFRGFNRLFDGITAAYGWTVGKLLRLSVIVLVVYGGLLGLTWWRVATAPTGFIPTQDQGYLLVNVQLPDSASVQRTDAILARIDKIARGVPGVAHTVGVSGESFLTTTNGSNLGTMFARSEAVRGADAGRIRRGDRREDPAAVQSGDRRRHRQRLSGAAHPGPGQRRGLQAADRAARLRGPRGAANDDGPAGPAGPRRPALCGGLHPVPGPHAAALRGHRPRQGPVAPGADPGCLYHPPGLHGGLLRQSVQQVRPHLAGQHPGRPRIPYQCRHPQAALCPLQPRARARARWCRWARSSVPRTAPAPCRSCATTCTPRPRSTASRRPASAPAPSSRR